MIFNFCQESAWRQTRKRERIWAERATEKKETSGWRVEGGERVWRSRGVVEAGGGREGRGRRISGRKDALVLQPGG